MRIQSGNTQGLKMGLKDNDFVLEAISKQMLRLQEKLKRLEADQKLPAEEKTRQRKQIEDQLNVLRQRYTQREMEMATEQKQAKPVSSDRSDVNGADMSVLINANGVLNRAKTGHSVKTSLESEKRTLVSEIQQDKSRGIDTTEKERKVSTLSTKIQGILEDMAAAQSRISDSSETDEDNKKKMHNEKNNRSGHVDMMV